MKRNSLSALDQIRAELKTCKDPSERMRLARRAREMRGTMLELVQSLPDAETARRQMRTETNPRARKILASYANALSRS